MVLYQWLGEKKALRNIIQLKMTQHESIKVKVEHFPGGFSIDHWSAILIGLKIKREQTNYVKSEIKIFWSLPEYL